MLTCIDEEDDSIRSWLRWSTASFCRIVIAWSSVGDSTRAEVFATSFDARIRSIHTRRSVPRSSNCHRRRSLSTVEWCWRYSSFSFFFLHQCFELRFFPVWTYAECCCADGRRDCGFFVSAEFRTLICTVATYCSTRTVASTRSLSLSLSLPMAILCDLVSDK